MTDKEAFISRLRRAAAVRVVPPRRAIVAVRPGCPKRTLPSMPLPAEIQFMMPSTTMRLLSSPLKPRVT